jgi:Mrp family chromosome partitioning ATPase
MAGRHPLLAEVPKSQDAATLTMNEEHFRKLEEERSRARTPGASLFGRPHAAQRPNPEPVRNLPALRPASGPLDPAKQWDLLSPITLDAPWLEGNGLFPHSSTEPAGSAFDIMRTRILLAMQDLGLRRIAITSPTHGCGKTMVAANLAFSLARRPGSRTLLMDLELRRPGLAALLGLKETAPLRDLLAGLVSPDAHLVRVGRTLALALNGRAEPQAAELLLSPSTHHVLNGMAEVLEPELMLFDLPPVLVSDDVIGFLPEVDAVLLVADGTQTTAEEVRTCERLFEGRTPLLGVVLNRAQDVNLSRYRYGRKGR